MSNTGVSAASVALGASAQGQTHNGCLSINTHDGMVLVFGAGPCDVCSEVICASLIEIPSISTTLVHSIVSFQPHSYQVINVLDDFV